MKTRNIWILFCTLVLQAVAQTYTWTNTAGNAQSWTAAGNWSSGSVPDPVSGDTVDFSTANIAANTTLTLEADRTAEIWKFGDTNNGQDWTVNAGNKIVLAGTTPTINVVNRTATLNNVLDGMAGLKKTGGGDLIMTGANTFSGGVELAGGRILIYDNTNEQSNLGAAANVLTFTGNATLHNNNNAVTMPQGITINSGVTATLSGAYGELTEMSGVLAGSGTMVVQGLSAGWVFEARNTANTFTGPIQILSGDSAMLKVRSLGDSPGAGKIGLQSNGDLGGRFEFMSGAIASLVLNHRQFELITNGSAGTNLGRQPSILNNASTAYTITITTDLLITGTGTKRLMLGGGNTGTNTFAGTIPDAIGADVLHVDKIDAGKWILSGTNAYNGVTTVSAGTLVANAAHALGRGNVTISSGALLVIGAMGAMTSSASLYLPSAITKNLTLNADAAVAKLFLGGVQQPNGTYTSWGAGTNWMNTGSGTLTVGPASVQPVYWDLDGSSAGAGGATPASTWDAANTYWNALYDGTGSVSAWAAGRTAAFSAGTNAVGTYTVTVEGTQDIGGLTFEEGTITLSGGTALRMVSDSSAYVASGRLATLETPVIEDETSRALTKHGLGTLVLSAVNAYTGPTTVIAGTLRLAHGDAISASSGLTLAGGSSAMLDTAATLKALIFEKDNYNETVSGGTLVFSAGGVITNKNDTAIKIQTISNAIIGSPSVALAAGSPAGGAEQYLQFAPTNGTVTLGTVNLAYNDGDGGDKSHLRLAGTTTGNSIAAVVQDYVYGGIRQVSGEWTFGNVTAGRIWLDGGTMLINGTFSSGYVGFAQAIPSGARLGGNFTYSCSASTVGHFIVNSGGIVAPGAPSVNNGIGTITNSWATGQALTATNLFKTGSIYEWQVGPDNVCDKVHILRTTAGSNNNRNLTVQTGMILKILDAGGTPKATHQLPVFTYDAGVTRSIGTVTVDMSALPSAWSGTPTLVDDGAGTVYLTGLQSPIRGTIIYLK